MTENNKVDRRWGNYISLIEGETTTYDKFKVKLLTINPNKSISLQYHKYREEYWIVIQGIAEIFLGDLEDMTERPPNIFTAFVGDVIKIREGTIHKIINQHTEDLIVLELQMGKETEETDIVRLEKIDGEI